MPQKIKVPKTIGEAKQRLAVITVDRRVSGWERAAIVWAHTNASRGRSKTPSGALDEVAEALGLSPRTIDRARKAWKTAMAKHGAPDIQPGDDVPQSILDLDYPPTEETDETGVTRDERGAKAYIAKNPKVVVEAIKAIPNVADAVTTAIADDTTLSDVVQNKVFAKRTGTRPGLVAPAMTPTIDLNDDLSKTLSRLGTLLRKEDKGEFTVNGLNESWLRIMGLQLNERATTGKADDDLFDQIDALLASSRGAV